MYLFLYSRMSHLVKSSDDILKYQILFPDFFPKKMSSAELAQRAVKVKVSLVYGVCTVQASILHKSTAGC